MENVLESSSTNASNVTLNFVKRKKISLNYFGENTHMENKHMHNLLINMGRVKDGCNIN